MVNTPLVKALTEQIVLRSSSLLTVLFCIVKLIYFVLRCFLGHALSITAHIVASYCGIACSLGIHGQLLHLHIYRVKQSFILCHGVLINLFILDSFCRLVLEHYISSIG